MKLLTENIIEEDKLRIEFVGWTNFENPNYSEISDEIRENLVADNEEPISHYVPKPEKKNYVKIMRRENQLAELLLTNRIFLKGIKFDGPYHQDGEYGCPLFKINDTGIFKWSCSFRYWGEVMEHAGYGLSYCDWAWDNPEEPVTPDMVEDCNFLRADGLHIS